MNAARIALLLRELADEFDLIDRPRMPDDAPAPPKSKPRKKRARTLVRPAGESDDMASFEATRLLRRNSFRVEE